MFAEGLVAWVYKTEGFFVFLASLKDLLFWKYLEMTLTSLFDLAKREGSGGTFSIKIRIGLDTSLLLLLLVGEFLE